MAISDPDETETSGTESDSSVVPVPAKRKRKATSPPSVTSPSRTQAQSNGIELEPARTGPSSQTSDLQFQPPRSTQSSSPPAEAPKPRRTWRPIAIYIDSLTVNVPAGHVGPILLNVPIPPEAYQFPDLQAPTTSTRVITAKLESPSPAIEPPATAEEPKKGASGFLKLPAELRNQIYEELFVNDGALRFSDPSDFCLSAAFLRTCRRVHEEGRKILYSNYFMFERRKQAHGSFWSPNWKEVGYRSILEFLKMIGPTNTGLLRQVGLVLEDAVPRYNPHLRSADSRRFINDVALLECLQLLGRFGRLQSIELSFNGRRSVTRNDVLFLDHLTALRADELTISTNYRANTQYTPNVTDLCHNKMVRRNKLYPHFRPLAE